MPDARSYDRVDCTRELLEGRGPTWFLRRAGREPEPLAALGICGWVCDGRRERCEGEERK